MEKLKWYYNYGKKFEEFSVLYDDAKFILVKNISSGDYSFGLKSDFGTLFGFPVNQSCLTVEKAKDILLGFIDIDEKYLDSLGDIARENIQRWKNMISALA